MRLIGDGEAQLESMTQLLEVSHLRYSSPISVFFIAPYRLVRITQGSCFTHWKASLWRKISVGTKRRM